jgi:hypothetical protein
MIGNKSYLKPMLKMFQWTIFIIIAVFARLGASGSFSSHTKHNDTKGM